ncbi:flagellar protein FlaG [Halomonas sp. YLGW01]|uniref:flagellar protein FlaG n=1 Tax=Halomonas sp. YLGW01 TaxID=2773308 RepID=UPI00177C5C18|nr:flagellar protein FlaG [Halomonas sp. YLGW01]
MTAPIGETHASSGSSMLKELTPRQRVDTMLAQLPPAGGTLAQAIHAPPAASRADLVAPIQRINQVMRQHGVEFELDSHTSRVVTRIVDRANGETIRQIPSEEVLRIAARLDALQGRLIEIEV